MGAGIPARGLRNRIADDIHQPPGRNRHQPQPQRAAQAHDAPASPPGPHVVRAGHGQEDIAANALAVYTPQYQVQVKAGFELDDEQFFSPGCGQVAVSDLSADEKAQFFQVVFYRLGTAPFLSYPLPIRYPGPPGTGISGQIAFCLDYTSPAPGCNAQVPFPRCPARNPARVCRGRGFAIMYRNWVQ